MADHDFIIPADLARAARALTQVSYTLVAKVAELQPERVRAYEHGLGTLDAAESQRLREALEHFGAVFIAEDEESGYGVRQKYNSVKTQRLETWEGEGGPAYEDDI
ncbi:XRE family transcriptional regulator [Microbacterium sp. A93]|uniref:XRE family transcriptional regulator n=1 Tax=Microbacterium sp. A93 TaxID=3450716 RepID=UPI003F41FD79